MVLEPVIDQRCLRLAILKNDRIAHAKPFIIPFVEHSLGPEIATWSLTRQHAVGPSWIRGYIFD